MRRRSVRTAASSTGLPPLRGSRWRSFLSMKFSSTHALQSQPDGRLDDATAMESGLVDLPVHDTLCLQNLQRQEPISSRCTPMQCVACTVPIEVWRTD